MRVGRGWGAMACVCLGLGAPGCFLSGGSDEPGTVEGRLFEAGRATPIASAEIKVGDQVVQTDAEGKFAIEASTADLVVWSKPTGRAATAKRVVPSSKGAYVELYAADLGAAAALDAASGGTVETATRKDGITLPPDALRKRDGTAVTGMVEASVTPLQASRRADLAALPGDTMIKGAGGAELLADPKAMLLVSLEQEGDPLDLVPGAQATIKVAAGLDDPASAKVFTFDEETAEWGEAGVASKHESDEGPMYVAAVAKAGPVMIGNEVPQADTSCVSACIQRDGSGEGAARARVEGVNHVAKVEVDVDRNGCFTATARANAQVRVVAVAKAAATAPQLLMAPPAGGGCADLGTLEATETEAPDCPGGFESCGADGACVDLQADPAHCGACGNDCAAEADLASASCIAGTCACPQGFARCDDADSGLTACTDTRVSRAHCGACDAPCDEGQECSEGTCSAIECIDPDTVLRGNFCEPRDPNGGGERLDCATIPGCVEVQGRWMFAVGMDDPQTTGDLVCETVGLTCVAVPVLDPPSAACVAFHPEAAVTSGASGWQQSVYCDGTAEGEGCNFEVKCHDCPACTSTGLTCGTNSSSLLTELFVECIP